MTEQIKMIDPKVFWQFSVGFWSDTHKRAVLLQAQDQHLVDCNLIMLLYFLVTEGMVIKNAAPLYQMSSDDQRLILRPLRAARQGLKGSDLYEQAKTLELLAEKASQEKLISALDIYRTEKNGEDQNAALLSMMTDYFKYLSVIAPYQQAVRLMAEIG